MTQSFSRLFPNTSSEVMLKKKKLSLITKRKKIILYWLPNIQQLLCHFLTLDIERTVDIQLN